MNTVEPIISSTKRYARSFKLFKKSYDSDGETTATDVNETPPKLRESAVED